jgi:hypothetical protein
MAGMKFEYDESGAKFVYFIISFYAMIIIPATYYFWPRKEIKSIWGGNSVIVLFEIFQEFMFSLFSARPLKLN